MKLGNENLLIKYSDLLEGKKIGILAHAASVDSEGTHIIDKLVKGERTGNYKVTAVFGPEHGLEGRAQDLEPVSGGKLKVQGKTLPVFSLYGKTFSSLSPTPDMIRNIDLLLVDLQDIGSRYYTYAATMAFCMRVCQAVGVEVVVCDRPNPINGIDVEGRVVDPKFRSFVGMFPIPVRHGKTIGELARLINDNDKPKRDLLKVIPMTGWEREWYFDKTGLKWVNPSPNIRSLTAAILYPGMCLLEGTNISEGRGTHTPFEICGAPWMDGEELLKEMRSLKLKGVDYERTVFTPTSRKFKGERCEGLQFIITDRSLFKPYLTGLALIYTVAMMYPKDFKWRREPYEFVTDIPAIDLLTGDGTFRKLVDKKRPFEDIAKLA